MKVTSNRHTFSFVKADYGPVVTLAGFLLLTVLLVLDLIGWSLPLMENREWAWVAYSLIIGGLVIKSVDEGVQALMHLNIEVRRLSATLNSPYTITTDTPKEN